VTTPSEPAAPPAGAGLEARVGVIEGKLDRVLGFLDKTPDKPAEPAPAERPEVNISEEIRKQLDERDAKKPADKPAPPAAPTPAALAEKQPKAPVRRVTRAMWGADE
jgi:hypothetical protein